MSHRNGLPFPESKVPDFNNKRDMETSLSGEVNKNDLSQVKEKFKTESNGANGASNLQQNGLLVAVASEIAKGKGKSH